MQQWWWGNAARVAAISSSWKLQRRSLVQNSPDGIIYLWLTVLRRSKDSEPKADCYSLFLTFSIFTLNYLSQNHLENPSNHLGSLELPSLHGFVRLCRLWPPVSQPFYLFIISWAVPSWLAKRVTIRYHTPPHHTKLNRTTPHCTSAPHHTALYRTTSHCALPHHITLHCTDGW